MDKGQKQLLSVLLCLLFIPVGMVASHALGFRMAWESKVLPAAIQRMDDGQYEAATAMLEPFVDVGKCGEYYEQAQNKVAEKNADYEQALDLIYLGEYRDAYDILRQYDNEATKVLSEYCKLRIAEEQANG